MTAFVRSAALSAGLVCSVLSLPASAQTGAPAPGASSGGSESVIVNGKQAERAGDRMAPNGMPAETSSNVFINGKPAAIGGTCPDGTSSASPNVFINGKPASIGCKK